MIWVSVMLSLSAVQSTMIMGVYMNVSTMYGPSTKHWACMLSNAQLRKNCESKLKEACAKLHQDQWEGHKASIKKTAAYYGVPEAHFMTVFVVLTNLLVLLMSTSRYSLLNKNKSWLSGSSILMLQEIQSVNRLLHRNALYLLRGLHNQGFLAVHTQV